MKQGRRLTREEKIIVSAHYLNPADWMLLADFGSYLKIIHKETKRIQNIDKRKKRK